MLGQKVKCFKEHTAVSLETLVPHNNFYRHIEAKLNLTFVRGLVKDFYSSVGRPSVDPVVFFKLQLIMFFEGIRSERKLMEMVNLNLAHRWFIGYDLDEAVPDHSSLTKIRERYGLETFQRFFEKIVELCIQSDLVWGKELYFDGTRVQANADIDSLEPRFYWEAKQHLHTLFPNADDEQSTSPMSTQERPSTPRGFVEKYGQGRYLGPQGTHYERVTDTFISRTDPDATPMRRAEDERSALGYHTHYVVDGGKARLVLAALVTPASVSDNTPMLDLAYWVRCRWRLHPAIAVGDSKYGTTTNILSLEHQHIRAYVPIPDYHHRSKLYPLERFEYHADGDYYTCPQGETLSFHTRNFRAQHIIYKASALTCYHCPVRTACTNGRSGREIRRSFFQADLDRIKAYSDTTAYQKALRKRSVWVEPLFGEAKQFHGLRRFRLRRLWRVNIEALLIAAGQNLKRLLSFQGWGKRQGPGGWTIALALPPSISFLQI